MKRIYLFGIFFSIIGFGLSYMLIDFVRVIYFDYSNRFWNPYEFGVALGWINGVSILGFTLILIKHYDKKKDKIEFVNKLKILDKELFDDCSFEVSVKIRELIQEYEKRNR